MFIERTLVGAVRKAERHFPAIIITGPRQVGKSSLLRAMHPELPYVTLDDPDLRQLAATDPKLFVQRYPAPLIIDEVQYAPMLFSVLKMAIDNDRRPGMYWLTGSQQFSLMKNVSDSLAGRIAVFAMGTLSGRELAGHPGSGPFLPPGWRPGTTPLTEPQVFERIWRGGFPELAVNPGLDPETFYSGYISTYLQRDVRDLAHVGDLNDFQRFMGFVAGRTGQLVNLAGLGNDTNVPYKRLKAWLSVLEASGLIFWLPAYHGNPELRLTKTAKLYLADTGLAAALARHRSPGALMTSAAAGAFLETHAVNEIRKSYLSNGLAAPLWLYRTADGKELDLVIIENGTVYPMDVKQASSIDRRTARRFAIGGCIGLAQGPGLVICPTMSPYPLSPTVDAYPAGWL